MKRITLHRFNNFLSLVVVGLCLYVIVAPFWPQATHQLKDDPPLAKKETPPPDENTLVIPAIKLQEVIHEGSDSRALSNGVWRHPNSGVPPNGGNTVMTGHRFTYAGKDVFYHLDKVKRGDKMTVFWDKQRYVYNVNRIEIVKPWQDDLVQQTEAPTLTVYTCTPLVTATNRLVIQAELTESPQ